MDDLNEHIHGCASTKKLNEITEKNLQSAGKGVMYGRNTKYTPQIILEY